jgi:hypothetical protein
MNLTMTQIPTTYRIMDAPVMSPWEVTIELGGPKSSGGSNRQMKLGGR